MANATALSADRIETIIRCHAQEFLPGAALATLLALATSSALHMPGSYLLPGQRKGLYRIAPELGFVETVMFLMLVLKGVYTFNHSLQASVRAALVLRFAKAEGGMWWKVPGETPTAKYCHEHAEPHLRRVKSLGQTRVIGIGLTGLALLKIFLVKGTVRTTLLAVSYGVPYFMIEILSLAALHFGSPQSTDDLETEALQTTDLIKLLDESEDAWQYRSTPRWQNVKPPLRQNILEYIVIGLFGLPALSHLIFWPFSVPLFLVFDFIQHRKGKWFFMYLTALLWGFWLGVLALVVSALALLPALILWKWPSRRDAWVENCFALVKSWFDDAWYVDAYALLKFALVVRYYLGTYTGEGTRTPGWIDWLG